MQTPVAAAGSGGGGHAPVDQTSRLAVAVSDGGRVRFVAEITRR